MAEDTNKSVRPMQAIPQGQQPGDHAILDKPSSGLHVPGAPPMWVEPPWVHAQKRREAMGIEDLH